MKDKFKKNKIESKILCINYLGVKIFFIMILLFLTIAAFLNTSFIRFDGVNESVYYVNDSIIKNVLAAFTFFLFVILSTYCLSKLKTKVLCGILVLWTCIIGVIWINSAQIGTFADSGMVVRAAQEVAVGKYDIFKECYFFHYPFQLGYVLFLELFIRIFNINTPIGIQAINVASLAIVYVANIVYIELVFKNKLVTTCTFVLFGICAQSILYCCFAYSVIPSLAFASLAVVFFALYDYKKKIIYLFFAAVMIGGSVMIKPNSMIVLVALIIIAILNILMNHNKKILIFIFLAFVFSIVFKNLAIINYESRGGVDLSEGSPSIDWLAMGLSNKDQESSWAPGWWNGYGWSNYENANHDSQKAKENSVKEVRKSLNNFSSDLNYTQNFFAKKILSQWNEPTYESIWFGWSRVALGTRNAFLNALYDKPGIVYELFLKYMKYYQQFIFLSALIYAISLFKRELNMEYVLIPLIIIGGFLYHTLFEAKSQYIIPYFIMLIPLAADGVVSIADYFSKSILKAKDFHKK